MFNFIQLPKSQDCQRLFHGRGHAFAGFEHVNIEWLAPVCLIVLYKEVESEWLQELADYLSKHIARCESVQVQYRCRHLAPIEVLRGNTITETNVTEHGLQYKVELGKNQNYGIFLDMANGRQWVMENAANKKVLNLFAYTCAFSVVAVAGGASKVVNVDISKSALSKGRDNHRLNQHDLNKVVFEGVNIFKSYSRLKKYGPYDLLICDPPSFQQGSVDIKRDYVKIISRLPQLMNQTSDLLLCLNSPDLDQSFLFDLVNEYCPQAKFQQEILPPPIFEEAHQGKGLKVLHFKYYG